MTATLEPSETARAIKAHCSLVARAAIAIDHVCNDATVEADEVADSLEQLRDMIELYLTAFGVTTESKAA